MTTKLWNQSDICNLLGISTPTMSNWKKRGQFPFEFTYSTQTGDNGLYDEATKDAIVVWAEARKASQAARRELYSYREAAEGLGLTLDEMAEMIDAGMVPPSLNHGDVWFYTYRGFKKAEKWLQDNA